MKRPAFLAIVISMFLLSLMLPITRMKIGVPAADVLPPSFESRMGSELLKQNYDRRESASIFIIDRTKSAFSEVASIKTIQSYETKIRNLSGVKNVHSFVDFLGQKPPEETAVILTATGTKNRVDNSKLAKGNYRLSVWLVCRRIKNYLDRLCQYHHANYHFLYCFGISMDYEVFLISRIKEEYEKSGDNHKSTALGLQKTDSLISSAAFILMVVVGSFIFTNIEITKALGIGLFSAIFIDATFIRLIVVPALMKLLASTNWWAPKWITGR